MMDPMVQPRAREVPHGVLGWYIVSKFDGVNVREGPNTDSTSVGQLQTGDWLVASDHTTQGPNDYTACGGTSNLWIDVTYQGNERYVTYLCVDYIHGPLPIEIPDGPRQPSGASGSGS